MLSIIFVIAFNLIYYYNFDKNIIPYSVVFISFFISSLLLYQYRLLVKNIFTYIKTDNSKQIPAVIFGAGVAGFLTKQAIESDLSSQYKLVAFLDDDPKKHGKEINGTKICGLEKLGELVKRHKVKKLVIATKTLTIDRKNEIVDRALEYNVKVSYVPSFEKWLRNEWDLKQIRDIHIEDLLGREEIRLDNPEIEKEIRGKIICITGAAGSIGSEIARQVLTYKPHTLVLIDQAESPCTRSSANCARVINSPGCWCLWLTSATRHGFIPFSGTISQKSYFMQQRTNTFPSWKAIRRKP